MKEITISNESFFDKDYWETFCKQEQYIFFAVNSEDSSLVPFYQALLKQVIGNKADEKFKDFALSKVQTEHIKTIFSQKIDETIPKIDKDDFLLPNQRLHWKGEDYDLNLSLVSPNNRRIWDFFKIVTIAEECLLENKPMYLSIE